jgi:hypothetical protein
VWFFTLLYVVWGLIVKNTGGINLDDKTSIYVCCNLNIDGTVYFGNGVTVSCFMFRVFDIWNMP